MTILELQRRIAEVGRIRIGEQIPTGRGKTRPAKLGTFRLTSPDRLRIEQAAGLYGGEPRPWKAPAGDQWEVITETDLLPVIVPPTDMAYSVYYELWSAGGCQRRCDGTTDSISDGPCLCDPDRRDCNIHTRLSVMLSDLPGLGVWRIDTQGWYASTELAAAVEVVRMAGEAGVMLPARLRLDQRMVKRMVDGKPSTLRFAVPILDVDITPAQLLGGGHAAAPNGLRADRPALTPTPTPALEPAPLTPVPDSVQERPVAPVAEQLTSAPQQRPRRANSPPPIPPTGLRPRTAQNALQTPPVAARGGSPDSPDGQGGGAAVGGRGEATPAVAPPLTDTQRRKLHATLRDLNVTDRADRLDVVGTLAGRSISSTNDLHAGEASQVIVALVDCMRGDDPLRELDELLAVTLAQRAETDQEETDDDDETR